MCKSNLPDSLAAGPDGEFWEHRFEGDAYLFGTEPSVLLKTVEPMLPRQGTCLDLAGGEGRNSVFLASRGLDVELWDISTRALDKAARLAAREGQWMFLKQVDLEQLDTLPEQSFDLITCFFYTRRELFPAMAAALKPGGVLVFENVTTEDREEARSHRKSHFRLKPNELLSAFSGLRVLYYREGPVPSGVPAGRQVASLVARREPGPHSPDESVSLSLAPASSSA